MPQPFTFAGEFTDPALERSLVAAMASQPELYWEIIDILPGAEAFTAAKEDFEAVATAIEEGKPPPAVEGDGAANPVEAARALADLYQKRELAILCQSLADSLRGGTPASDLINRLEGELTRVSQTVRESRAAQAVSVFDLLPGVLKDAQARQEAVREKGSVAVGLPTGINKVDKMLGGLQPGLHLLAAGPGEGKTSLCLQIGGHVSWYGSPVIFVSFEESINRLALKALCQPAGLESKRFADGYGNAEQLKVAAHEHGPDLANLFLVEGTARLEVARLKALALQAINRTKTDKCLLIVDYLQRWAASRREYADFRHVVSGLVSELRELALRLDSPILVISSQNRPGQGSANLTSLKESGDLEYSADTALFLVEDEKRTATPPARAVNLEIEKNRYGSKGTVALIFKPDIGTFREQERGSHGQ